MRAGEVLADRFEIERLAGSGGMGTVYRARDRQSDEPVAVKLLSRGEEDRFLRECRLLAELNHPAIVRHVAHGQLATGEPYLAMEWLEGEDLAARPPSTDSSNTSARGCPTPRRADAPWARCRRRAHQEKHVAGERPHLRRPHRARRAHLRAEAYHARSTPDSSRLRMYAAPAEPAEASDSSAQWLAAAVAGALIAPNMVTMGITLIAMPRLDEPLIYAMYGCAAAAYAAVSVLIVFLAAVFARRLTSGPRRLLVGASVSAAIVGIVGAAWRFAAGPLPPLIIVLRDASMAFVYLAAGTAVAQLCQPGFRRSLGYIAAILACATVLAAVAALLGVRIPMSGIADLGAWVVTVIALAAVPRRVRRARR